MLLFKCSYSQQNLVMNPSFETYTACPNGGFGNDVIKATGWDTCRSTPDYFNVCSSFSQLQAPVNYFGHQKPAQGNAYCGFYTYDSSTPNYREIIIGTLTSQLSVAQKYYISFKVNRADSNFIVGYSTNKMGVKFTKVKQGYVPINNTAHYYSNALITDTVNWTKISGAFVADSAYKYIMIGNFFDAANTTVFNHGNGPISYYYIDEVCVSNDSVFTENYSTVIIPISPENTVNIFPNPANDIITLSGIKEGPLEVYNILGESILKFQMSNKQNSINTGLWPSGLYFIVTKGKKYKIIINH